MLRLDLMIVPSVASLRHGFSDVSLLMSRINHIVFLLEHRFLFLDFHKFHLKKNFQN